MNFTMAITRLPGLDFAQGLTTSELGVPEYELLLKQHAAYIAALRSLGLAVTVLEPLAGYPDAYFVEDVAVLTPEVSVVTRPGAPSRTGETQNIEAALPADRPIRRIQSPGTLEGGDVMIIERQAYIGLSARTNASGAEQLGEILAEHGYTWSAIQVPCGLHLKTSVTYVGNGTLLTRAELAGVPEFQAYNQMIVPPAEALAANTLPVNGSLLVAQGFPLTYRMLETLDVPLIALDITEVQKMDGGLTCLSLRY